VPGKPQQQIYHTMREVVREARTTLPDGGMIRIGLTGLAAESRSATEATFSPCLNISTAARQITQLVDRCKTVPSFKADPVHCAIAACELGAHPTTTRPHDEGLFVRRLPERRPQ
jgi:hypothetical protein